MMAGERADDLATSRYNRGLTDFLNVAEQLRAVTHSPRAIGLSDGGYGGSKVAPCMAS